MNLIDADLDMVVSLVGSNLNETYRPIIKLEEVDKGNNLFLLIKVYTFTVWIKG